MPTITTLPSVAKPRERLLRVGSDQVSLEELIATIIGSGSSQQGVLELASQVAIRLQNGVVTPHDLLDIPGIGMNRALQIVAAVHLGEKLKQVSIITTCDAPDKIYAAMGDILTGKQEHLAVFYLGPRAQALRREIISIGTVNSTLLHCREIFRPAILHGASYIVLAHTHPSGSPEPSQADVQATRQVAQAGEYVGIELLDHVICAADGYTSLRQQYPDVFRIPLPAVLS